MGDHRSFRDAPFRWPTLFGFMLGSSIRASKPPWICIAPRSSSTHPPLGSRSETGYRWKETKDCLPGGFDECPQLMYYNRHRDEGSSGVTLETDVSFWLFVRRYLLYMQTISTKRLLWTPICMPAFIRCFLSGQSAACELVSGRLKGTCIDAGHHNAVY